MSQGRPRITSCAKGKSRGEMVTRYAPSRNSRGVRKQWMGNLVRPSARVAAAEKGVVGFPLA